MMEQDCDFIAIMEVEPCKTCKGSSGIPFDTGPWERICFSCHGTGKSGWVNTVGFIEVATGRRIPV